MSQTIIIDKNEYLVSDLPDNVRAILGLMQENQGRINKATVDLQLANAANTRLQADLGDLIKAVKPIKPAEVETKPVKRTRKTPVKKK